MKSQKKINKKLLELQHFGSNITFEKNSKIVEHGHFSEPTPELYAWYCDVQNIVCDCYNGCCGIADVFSNNLLKQYDNAHTLQGCDKETFNSKINLLLGAIKSCLETKPQKNNIRI